ncbi:hypothetical protein PV325_001973 [Microctonus aethiopoides]|nr:hypothetical protein PV325_001973 [Microctonus aethiopoides]
MASEAPSSDKMNLKVGGIWSEGEKEEKGPVSDEEREKIVAAKIQGNEWVCEEIKITKEKKKRDKANPDEENSIFASGLLLTSHLYNFVISLLISSGSSYNKVDDDKYENEIVEKKKMCSINLGNNQKME